MSTDYVTNYDILDDKQHWGAKLAWKKCERIGSRRTHRGLGYIFALFCLAYVQPTLKLPKYGHVMVLKHTAELWIESVFCKISPQRKHLRCSSASRLLYLVCFSLFLLSEWRLIRAHAQSLWFLMFRLQMISCRRTWWTLTIWFTSQFSQTSGHRNRKFGLKP